MTDYPKPPNDKERLEALRAMEVLDTASEKDFDEIVLLASRICGTPMSMITLVDEERQWFKARVGMDDSETHRRVSFCSHAILQSDILVVHDATTDDRFRNNEFVTGHQHIRFYAGAQLVTDDGFKLGTLCVVDTQPKQFSWAEGESLKTLANLAMRLLTLRLKDKQIASANKELQFKFNELEKMGFRQNLLVSSMNEHMGKTLDSMGKKKAPHTARIARDFMTLAADWVKLQKAGEEDKTFVLSDVVNSIVKEYMADTKTAYPMMTEDISSSLTITKHSAKAFFIVSNLIKFLLLSLDKTDVEIIAGEYGDEIIISFLQSKGSFYKGYEQALSLTGLGITSDELQYSELAILYDMTETIGGSLRIEAYKQDGLLMNLVLPK